MKMLITGGAGFIGSNFVHYMLNKYPDYEIVVLDKLTYAGRLENLEGAIDKIKFIKGDICNPNDVEFAIGGCDIVVNFAAESHVDRSIKGSLDFVRTNIEGTHVLLDAARKHAIKKFLHISTDEVYGQIMEGSFKEDDSLNPRNPYSATKAAAELLCLSFFTTYGVPVVITRSSNNYGPRQFPEKLIPVLVLNALHQKPLPIYGEGKQVRDWIYVDDNCEGIDVVLHKGKTGEIYNIGGLDADVTNLEVAKMILNIMRKPESLITFVEDRLGHDFRYSLDFSKLKELGWEPKTTFEDGLRKTVEWYLQNEKWWRPLLDQEAAKDAV